MKLKSIIAAAFVVLGFTMTSCEYDNYDAPSYVFSGQLKCDGENFPFDSNKGLLRVFQSGYGKVDGGGTGYTCRRSGTLPAALLRCGL